MIIKGRRFRPESVVSFYTEEGKIVARSTVSKEGKAIDSDVVQINTNNDLNGDAGTFQIILTAKNRWDKVLASNDLVFISMGKDGTVDSKENVVMIGLVDDVRKTATIQGTTVQRQVSVTGRNFAKALINFEVGVIQEVDMTVASLGWLQGRINFMGQDAANIIKQVMEQLVFKYMEYSFSNGKTLKELVKMKLDSRDGERLFDDKSFVNFQGSMQSFVKEIVDEPFNQVFWEVYKGEPTMVVRETPFNKTKWRQLTMHEIDDEDVVLDETGRSDIESYSLFSVGLQSFFNAFDINKTTNVFPLWYEPYFKKHGLKRLHRFTAYAGYGSSEDSGDVSEILKRYQKDLFNWNIHNPSFFNGSLTVRGDAKYKVGDRLLYQSNEDGRTLEFFIESVSHDFVNFSHWITRLSVTRGLPSSGVERFKAPWGKYEEYTGGALGNPAAGDIQNTGGTGGGNFNFPSYGATGSAGTVVANAQSWLSKPNSYVFGGGRSYSDIARGRFDCSSFIRHVFEVSGINVGPLTSTTTDTLAKQGTPVNSIMYLKPGDLVFWHTYKHNGHVGIYLGDGKAIGSQDKKGVGIIDMNNSYWKPKLSATMRRVIL
jgi:cell wall-associated NlpC family hydrolase